MNCPTCGRPLTFQPHPSREGFQAAYCECNPVGPVVETPKAAFAKPEKGTASKAEPQEGKE